MELSISTHSENRESIGRRRRWWLLVPFCILAILMMVGVLVFAKPSSGNFRFLAGIPAKSHSEVIISLTTGSQLLFEDSDYSTDKETASFSKQIVDELIPLGWKENRANLGRVILYHPQQHGLVQIKDVGGKAQIAINQSRPPTFLDRVRHWFKDRLSFLSPKPPNRTTR